MTHRFFFALGFALLASASLMAQSDPMSIDIPFAFHVGNDVLPPGHYSVTPRLYEIHLLKIRCTGCSGAAMTVVNSVHASKPRDKFTLEFMRYGSDYFLERVWTPGYDQGSELIKSKAEQVLVRNINTTQPALVALTKH